DRSVLEQRPAGGTPVRPGATVTIVVAHVRAPALVQTSCTPGYSPCLPPASDYDCGGGSGNGPEYVDQTVTVTGSDPYELDSDGDGYGCE
ncbi:MAG TPA: PASTA domain-containing protein, partial [Nocardioides sp.]|nr:PASTA domain-containing protein [Nocardioides sp.]